MLPSLASKAYIFDPRPNYPFLISAKRYWLASSLHLDDSDALTLVFAHATGFHKELYEPTIEDLYMCERGRIRIRDVWSIDAPNCGESADLNEEYLRWGYEPIFGWQEYGRAIHAFLTGLGTGVDVDFSKRRLVLIGHSFSAVSQVLALTYHPPLKPELLILLEIMCLRPEDTQRMMTFLVNGSERRRDIWSSREAAYEQFKTRVPWKTWDARVLGSFVEHGLRPLPSLEYPDKDKDGVTLRCTRRQETATYRDTHASGVVYRMMHDVARRIPTHLVYGAIDDYIPRRVKDVFLELGVGGEQNLASLTRIPGAGHLAAQTHPRAFAEVIASILGTHTRPATKL
ncbi:Alpha/beta hydrolase fold-1 [Mycena amicta]|nr:Alpha/beta hydrolase fold-1 [Mycena amicta]